MKISLFLSLAVLSFANHQVAAQTMKKGGDINQFGYDCKATFGRVHLEPTTLVRTCLCNMPCKNKRILNAKKKAAGYVKPTKQQEAAVFKLREATVNVFELNKSYSKCRKNFIRRISGSCKRISRDISNWEIKKANLQKEVAKFKS